MFSMLLAAPSDVERGAASKRRGGTGWLPVGRKQDGQVVLVGHGWKLFEDVSKITLGVVAVAAGAFDERIDDGAALAGGFAAHEEPVLLTNRGGTNAVFYPVVVDLKASMVDVAVEPVPDGQRVVNGAAKFALGQDLGVLAQGHELGFEDFQMCPRVFAADALPLRGIGVVLAKPGFNLIDLLDGGEGASGEGLADLQGFMEFPAGMRPAGDEGDAGFAGGPRVVAGIGVGLQEALVISYQLVEAGGLAAGVPLIKNVALDAIARGVDDPEVAGGGFAFAGTEVFDRGFVGLEVAALQEVLMDELVEGLDDVGDDLGPVAEDVAGEVDAVAAKEDALGAVEGAVVAVFGGQHVGDEAGCGSKSEGGWRGGFERCGIQVFPGNVDGANDALDEDDGALVVETVGGHAIDLAKGSRVGFDFVGDEVDLADREMGDVAGFAWAALFGGGWFSRRSGVCGIGGGGFFCGIGIQQEFELGGVECFALLVVEAAKDLADLFAQELVLGG